MSSKPVVFLDVETYPNYFCAGLRRLSDGKTAFIELTQDRKFDARKLAKIFATSTVVTFNGNWYDRILCDAAIAGLSNKSIYSLSKSIIEDKMTPWNARREYDIAENKVDHIDLKNVCPLNHSLKKYAGRLHAPVLQDLPYDPHEPLSVQQIEQLKIYCGHDLYNTELVYKHLKKDIELREKIGDEIGVDVRSKSDAQIAESVIKSRMIKDCGKSYDDFRRVSIDEDKKYKFKAPDFISFDLPELSELVKSLEKAIWQVGKNGHMLLPEEIRAISKVSINQTEYKIGLGGIHSTEKNRAIERLKDIILRDYDVASYYPAIIINNKLYPKHLGVEFLNVYKSIVDRRLKAKAEGDKATSDSLKITINGTFGKLASKYSFLYSPDMMMHVTLIGQLSLLMLIERLEASGIECVSANTDGVVLRYGQDEQIIVDDIVEEWEWVTSFDLEHTDYNAVYSRDVNNYIAVKSTGDIKGKGLYTKQSDRALWTDPRAEIINEALKEALVNSDRSLIKSTIMNCEDPLQFLFLRNAQGGAVSDGKYLGKCVRWYWSKSSLDAINYLKNGTKVTLTDMSIAAMTLKDINQDDIDKERYVQEALKQMDLLT